MHTACLHSDQQLVERLSANDTEAFAEIYRRYWELLLGMAYNRLKSIQAAEDVVHDVMASVWNNRQRQEIKSLKNYLATAVKYMVLKEVRKAMLQQVYKQKQPGAEPYNTLPDAALDNKRLLEMINREIETLPEKCQLIFRYSREQGLSVKQIADEMNISPKTVENQLNKALRRLRVAAKKHAFFLFSAFF